MNFSEPKQLSDGRYFSRVLDRTIVQLNGVVLTTNFADSDSVTLQLTNELVSKIKNYESKVKTTAVENSTQWFGKELSEKTITAAFSADGDVMNVSKSTSRGQVITKAYNSDKETIDPNTIGANTMCDVVLEMTGVWFLKKSFGIVWKVIQVRMRQAPKPKYYEEYLFQDDEESLPEDAEEDEDYA